MKIVTDSSVMFSVEEGARRGMAVLPLVVTIDGQSWLEYEDVSLSLIHIWIFVAEGSVSAVSTAASISAGNAVFRMSFENFLSKASSMRFSRLAA